MAHGVGVVLAFVDALLQERFKFRINRDRRVEQRVGAGLVGAHGNQVARALVAREQLLEAAYEVEVFVADEVIAREIDCSMSMAG